jgi:hypothetical protein
MKIIKVGLGEIVSTPGISNGKPALIIEPANKPGVVGYDAGQPELHEDAIVLEIHAAEGVEVLVDDIRKALEKHGVHVPASIQGAAPIFN